ncbi:MAG: hypothetical protein HY532_03755, partial [Chloroflexi bacterium]|nr:hypothetical protein [Chloroflexota bacterium]
MVVRQYIRPFLAWAAILALVYGSLGPLVDHHFMERLPFHGHVFLMANPGFHLHPGVYAHTYPDDAPHRHSDVLFTSDSQGYSADGFAGWQLLALLSLLSVAPPLLTRFAGSPPNQPAHSPALSPP